MTYQNTPKVPLMTLTQRVSKSGRPYLTGFLGQASVIAFQGEPTEYGETWNVFLQERPQRSGQPRPETQPAPQPRPRRQERMPEALEQVFVDDPLPF